MDSCYKVINYMIFENGEILKDDDIDDDIGKEQLLAFENNPRLALSRLIVDDKVVTIICTVYDNVDRNLDQPLKNYTLKYNPYI